MTSFRELCFAKLDLVYDTFIPMLMNVGFYSEQNDEYLSENGFFLMFSHFLLQSFI